MLCGEPYRLSISLERQLPPAAFSVRHIPAAFSIDAKGPTIVR